MNEATVGGVRIELVQGDITRESTEAVVNAANSGLRGGGGVDGAIHRAGGPSILEECRRIGGCPTGFAVATGAGRLAARRVIHAVAPVWSGGGRDEPRLLASAYRASLETAEAEGLRSIAFPSLGTGAYRYPVEAAARIALETVRDHLGGGSSSLELVRFVLFDAATLAAYRGALATVSGTPAGEDPGDGRNAGP